MSTSNPTVQDLQAALEYNVAQARFYAQWNIPGYPWPRYVEVHEEINQLLNDLERLQAEIRQIRALTESAPVAVE